MLLDLPKPIISAFIIPITFIVLEFAFAWVFVRHKVRKLDAKTQLTPSGQNQVVKKYTVTFKEVSDNSLRRWHSDPMPLDDLCAAIRQAFSEVEPRREV